MKKWSLVLILFLQFAYETVFAEEPRIIETENGFVVEYSGTPDPESDKKRIRELEQTIKSLVIETDNLSKQISGVTNASVFFSLAQSFVSKSRELISARNELNELTIKDPDKLESASKELSLQSLKIDQLELEANQARAKRQTQTIRRREGDDVRVSSINATQLRTTMLGDAEISIKADVCNDGARGKIWVRVTGVNFDGYELADKLFSAITLDSGQCRTISDTAFVDMNRYLNIREWKVKEADKYNAQ